MPSPQMIAFLVFFVVAIASAFSVILQKNPVSSALSLILTLFSFAGIYALESAHLVAALQILVYTGAIMVLFIFVIMLLAADTPVLDLVKTSRFTKFVIGVSGATFFWILVSLVRRAGAIAPTDQWTPEKIESAGGNTVAISGLLFSRFYFAFELTSFLILAAIVATIALAKRQRSQS